MLDAILLASDAARQTPAGARLDHLVRSDRRASRHDRHAGPPVAGTRRRARHSADVAAGAAVHPPRPRSRRTHHGHPAAARGGRDARDRRKRHGAVLAVAGRVLQPASAVRPRGDPGDNHAREKFSAVPAVAGAARALRADVSVDERDRGASASTRRTIAGGSRRICASWSSGETPVDRRSGLQRRALHRHAARAHSRSRSHTPRPREGDHRRRRLLERRNRRRSSRDSPMSCCAATSATAARAGPCGRASSAPPATT